jgi:hypothetical protein
MAWWNALVAPVASVFGKALDIIDDMVPDKDLAAKLKVALQQRIIEIASNEFVTLLQGQTKIVLAEAGGGWLQRNWRPLLMATFGVIIANNYILFPIIGVWKPGMEIMMQIPPDMWSLLKIGLGGYIVGRSAEKIASGGGVRGAIDGIMSGA